MPIVPADPTNSALPTDSSLVEQAQAEFRALKAYMQGDAPYAIVGAIISQPGDIIWSAVSTRKGSLYCNGQAVSRTTYAALFAVIGSTYGAGNGTTTFNVPDLRGRTMFGFDTGNATGRLTNSATGGINANAAGNSGGLQAHAMSVAELAVHAHANTLANPVHHHTPNAVLTQASPATGFPLNNGGSPYAYLAGSFVTTDTAQATTITNVNTGAGTPFNIVSPGLVLYPWIKC